MFGMSVGEAIVVVFTIGLIVFGILYGFLDGVPEKRRSRKMPVISRPCKIIDKRVISSGGESINISNSYYVTCEFENGSREEVEVASGTYGLIVVGDNAILKTQGVFVSIERVVKDNSVSSKVDEALKMWKDT
ncbi:MULTISPECIES: DUF2500 family protein [Paenibacillus]|uniref:DUF2500 family protein n=1 Tax=Paenibacillus TaxID=44249 RepID=UPI0011A41BEE|nr:DUF2500 family protein [Paenibacillus sp. Y412MC10]